MEHGICIWMSAAMRAEASHRSEMVSQLLFGECYEVLQVCDDWVKISTTDCHYEGWIAQKQHTEISDSEYRQWMECPKEMVRADFQYLQYTDTKIPFPILIGSIYPQTPNGFFTIGGKSYTVMPTENAPVIRHEGLSEKQDQLLTFAFHYLNAPYLWGGRTLAGIDCSGFTQIVFRSIGIDLPRDASQQVSIGTVVDFVEEARIGDIAFFENEEGRIIHVGIVCGQNQIIHASGHVQINTLDSTGIFNNDIRQYTHRLRIIKRIL